MEQLKTYAVPLVALVLMLVWFFVIRPMLDEGEAAPDEQAEKAEPAKKAEQANEGS